MVGGAVRDEILGLPIKDKDYVVVGSTPQEMEKQGFISIGRDFPVFLHPKTKEEYALARTEKKISYGYKGFKFYTSPSVTLREDLSRRDLTINAIAKNDKGEIIDPFGGVKDLKAKIIRHVSNAFVEDPLRALRVARFASRFKFNIDHETKILLKTIVDSGEISFLTNERIWQEFSKGLMEQYPSEMLKTLRECGALDSIFEKIMKKEEKLYSEKTFKELGSAIDYLAVKKMSLNCRFALLTFKLAHGTKEGNTIDEKNINEFFNDLRVPKKCSELALLTLNYHKLIFAAKSLEKEKLLKLIYSIDAMRRTDRFKELLSTCRAISLFFGKKNTDIRNLDFFLKQVLRLKTIKISRAIKNKGSKKEIQTAIWEARLQLLENRS